MNLMEDIDDGKIEIVANQIATKILSCVQSIQELAEGAWVEKCFSESYNGILFRNGQEILQVHESPGVLCYVESNNPN